MQVQHLMSLQKFMMRVNLQGTEVHEFTATMNALSADVSAAQAAAIAVAAAQQVNTPAENGQPADTVAGAVKVAVKRK
jgi:hypothetical protein